MANTLILASGSPRRREMLENLGIPIRVIVSNCDETFPADAPIAQAVRAVAMRKAADVEALDTEWVLAADTVVEIDGQLLGKPVDADDAKRMLRSLSGRWHRVITGVALAHGDEVRSLAVETKVRMNHLTDEQLGWYIDSGEPMDKAGAYGIQGLAAAFVEEVEGSYSNVVGLPLAETMKLLEDVGYAPWQRAGGGQN